MATRLTCLGVLSFVINMLRTIGPKNVGAKPLVGQDRFAPPIAEWK